MAVQRFMGGFAVAAVAVVALSGAPHSGTPKEHPKETIGMYSILSTPSACIGTESLKVRIIIANAGDNPVVLETSSVSTIPGFIAFVDTEGMKLRHQTLSIITDPIGKVRPASTLTLPPKGFFEKDMEIPIRDPFFGRAGFYELNLSGSYRVVEQSQPRVVFSSSSAFFELHACESR